MKRGLSRRITVTLVVAVLVAAAGLISPKCWPVPKPEDRELVELHEERERMRAFDAAVLADLRTRVARSPVSAWSDAELQHAAGELGGLWRIAWQPRERGLRRLQAERTSVSLDEWGPLRAEILRWIGRPGVVLEALDLSAKGTGRGRQFARVQLRLAFAVADPPPALPSAVSTPNPTSAPTHDHTQPATP